MRLHNQSFFVNKGFYNKYAADIWMWMIFLEWIYNCFVQEFCSKNLNNIAI